MTNKMADEGKKESKLELNLTNVLGGDNSAACQSVEVEGMRSEFDDPHAATDQTSIRFQRSVAKYSELVDLTNQFKLYQGSNLLTITGYGLRTHNETHLNKKTKSDK